jgi:small subunit ribosomal protein S17
MEENKINPSEEQVETEAPAEAVPAKPVDETAPEPALESETSAEPEPAAAPATEPASEPALETPAAEAAPEPEPEPEPEPALEPEAAPATEPASEPALETPAAGAAPEPALEPEAAPATEPAPAQPAKRARSHRHVPRHERRQRTGKAQAKKPAKRGERKPIVSLPKPESERGKRQERRGVVVSAAMDKTVVIKVDTLKAHRKYGKVMRRSKKFHAHDEANSAKVGDIVRIVETRPLSATKRWRVVEILEVAK